MISTARQCKAPTRTGAPCRVACLAGKEYCFTHDPATATERRAARSRGGAARHGRSIGGAGDYAPVTIASVTDIVPLLARTINDCLLMENSLNRARTIGYLAIALAKVFEVAELDERLKVLEARYEKP